MKLNGAHKRTFHADGVYILEQSASGLCRFRSRLQQNAIAYGIYGMKDFTSSANNRYLQSSVFSILKIKCPESHPCRTPLKISKGNEKVSKTRTDYCR